VLLRRFPLDAAPAGTAALHSGPGSEALLYVSAPVDPSRPVEEVAQPFRFRQWLFAQAGGMPEFGRLRPRLLSALPEFLRRQLKGDTEGEISFALFLRFLRESGRTDDVALDAALAAQLLSRTVRMLQQTAAEGGVGKPSGFNLLATNGRVLVAARPGEAPLSYTLLEGSPECARCKLDPSVPESEQAMRAHRRRRTVVLASHPLDASAWIEVPPGTAVAVDGAQNVQRLPL